MTVAIKQKRVCNPHRLSSPRLIRTSNNFLSRLENVFLLDSDWFEFMPCLEQGFWELLGWDVDFSEIVDILI